MIGDQLSDNPRIYVERLFDDPIQFRVEGSPIRANPNAVSNEHLVAYTIPKELAPGVYRYSIETSSGAVAGLLNAPVIYWTQGDLGPDVSAGGWLRIFGRNIARNGQAQVEISNASERWTQKPIAQSPWDALFKVPEGIEAGTYLVRMWNGQGDASAWSGAVEIHILQAQPEISAVVNVRDYGAKGDGQSDDTRAINEALKALATRGGGTLFFPVGRYYLSAGITIPSRTTLKGEGRDLVALAWKDFDVPPEAMLEGSSDFGIEDITIYTGNHRHIITGGVNDPQHSEIGNIKIRRVIIRASAYRGHISAVDAARRQEQLAVKSFNGSTAIRLSGANLEIVDCDIYSSMSAFLLLRPHGAVVRGNKFYNGRGGWYSISGANSVIFENNQIVGADLFATGGGINTLFDSGSASQNIFFAHNNLSLMHGWDGEAMTSDGPGGLYFGNVNVIGANSLSLNQPVPEPGRWLGAAVLILSGRGMGQYALIASVVGAKIALDRSLKVLPDASSKITVVPLQKNYILFGNTFLDAGIGIQFYGTAIDHIVADNKSVRTAGFAAWGLKYKFPQPNWFVQFLNNSVTGGAIYGRAPDGSYDLRPGRILVRGAQNDLSAAPMVIGVIVRNNDLKGNAQIRIEGGSKMQPTIEGLVVEENSIRDVDKGVIIEGEVGGLVERRNLLERAGGIRDRPALGARSR